MQIEVAHLCVVIYAHTHTCCLKPAAQPCESIDPELQLRILFTPGKKKILLLFIFILIMMKNVPVHHF